VSKTHFYLGLRIIFFCTLWISKWGMSHSDMLKIFVILQLKKQQGDVLE